LLFTATTIPRVFIIDIEPHHDERGFFARSWCEDEAAAFGIQLGTTQCNISFNAAKGTLRGMHYQAAPFEEAKLIRCTAGAIWDVAVDIRPESPTFGRHVGVELTATNRRMLYVPEGCAHGFLTLANETEVSYQMSTPFAPGQGRGFRWDDAQFRIVWPQPPAVISERDRTYPDFQTLETRPSQTRERS
jgi:dTDP-4-dehydrorhamnose 3,5-epimerase